MNTNVALTVSLLLPTIGGFSTFISYEQRKTESNEPITYHTHAEQMVHSDGNDVNTDFDAVKWQSVNFEQKFKRIYLNSVSGDFIKANCAETSLKQTNTNTDSNDSGTCGGKGYEWDMNKRIHDWTNDFNDNLYLHLSTGSPTFGYSKQSLYLKEKKILGSGQNYKSLTCPTKFGKLYNHASDINFDIGMHRDLNSGKWNVYGINKAWLKETAHVAIFYNWVDRFLWTLNAGDAPHQKNVSCKDEDYGPIKIDEGGINVGSFNLEHLIKISEPNFQNKSIKLIINDEYRQFINEWHNDLKNKPIDQLSPPQKLLMDKFKLTSSDDPWQIIQDIKDNLILDIDYQISDPVKSNEFKTERIQINYDSLVKGIDIHLNKNDNNEYLIKFPDISNQEIIKQDLYIQKCSTKEIENQNTQIELANNGFYKLTQPKIQSISFKNYDINKIKDIYSTSLSDLEILKLFVTIVDSYGIVDDFSLLSNSMYQIKHDDLNGEVEIKINVNEIKLIKIFSGFKRINNSLDELDASKVAYNIIPEEIDNKKIHDIFLGNGFNESVVKDFLFKISNIDNFKGVVEIQVAQGQLIGHVYKIKNLQPYYIKIKNHIDKKYLSKISSNINIDELKEHYLDVSSEFWSRNQESISFSIQQNKNSKIVNVKLSYYEEFNNRYKNVDLTIKLINEHNKSLFMWVGIVLGIVILASGIYFIYRKKMKNINGHL